MSKGSKREQQLAALAATKASADVADGAINMETEVDMSEVVGEAAASQAADEPVEPADQLVAEVAGPVTDRVDPVIGVSDCGTEWPIRVQVLNHTQAAFVEPSTGLYLPPGGAVSGHLLAAPAIAVAFRGNVRAWNAATKGSAAVQVIGLPEEI